jgi:hypothetical protein
VDATQFGLDRYPSYELSDGPRGSIRQMVRGRGYRVGADLGLSRGMAARASAKEA